MTQKSTVALDAEGSSEEYVGMTVDRQWGSYTLLEISGLHKVKSITVQPDQRLSLQLHYHRNESWIVVCGIAEIEIENEKFLLQQGECTFIRAGEKHRLSNPGQIPLEIIEVQLGELVDETDIVRFDDEYGRIG
jgi:mannose-1-phosphate guanylyltransferase / mannose-6-phosphate isomerase